MRIEAVKEEDSLRLAAMWNPFNFVGEDMASNRHVEDTFRELYSARPHIMATLGIGLAGLTAYFSGSPAAGILATLLAAMCLCVRYDMSRRFAARSAGKMDPKWVRLFVAGSLMSGLGLGTACALLFYDTSMATQTMTLGVVCAIVQGVAGRAYMMPGTASINTACIITLVSLAAVADGNYVIAPAGLLYFLFLSNFIRQMVQNRQRQLRAEQLADRLFKQVLDKNELLRIANETLAAKAYEDPLTGLANRRKFDLALSESLTATRNRSTALSLMMIDVDHFKDFNDTYGHQAGDGCLQALSSAITRTVSQTGSVVARYGGEEFVVILPDVDRAGALVIAEQIRIAVRLTNLADLPNKPPSQTVSIGIASCEDGELRSREEILSAADAALYEAKKQGRNRVCVDPPPFSATTTPTRPVPKRTARDRRNH
jgi:diguanylate cyclase (GGDEF)-like protein